MATFIVQGRFSSDAIRGMVAKPFDRREAVERLIAASGGKLKDYYVTTGENDFLIVIEAENGESAVVAGMAAAASGTVSHIATARAWTTGEFKQMAERAGEAIGAYEAPG